MVVESDADRRDVTEAILATSRFAVAPVESIEGALAICRALAPTVIVCHEAEAWRLREGLLPLVIPMVTTTARPEPDHELIERIRVAIRGGWHSLHLAR
jgi:hypothetical protein